MCLFYCGEIALAQITDHVLYRNGAFRHAASIGSPVGLATAMSVLTALLVVLWIKEKKKLYLIGVILGLLCTFSTATRSISVLITLYVLGCFWFVSSGWQRFVLIAMGAIGIYVFLSMNLEDSGIVSRLDEAIALSKAGEIDQSSLFRVLIFDTYTNDIELRDFLFGLGLGGFPNWFFSRTLIDGVAPHFEWLWMVSEFGVLVFFLYLVLLAYALYRLIRAKPLHIFLFLAFCITAHQTIFQFANPMYFYQAYMIFALMVGWYLAEMKKQSWRG